MADTRMALSLWEPWATLLAGGIKENETRHWRTNYRGEVLIHAASYMDHELVSLSNEAPFDEVYHLRPIALFSELPRKCIIGRFVLVDCVPTNGVLRKSLSWQERTLGDYSSGRWAWIGEKHELFKDPIPCRGMPSLFQIPDDVATKLPIRL